MPQCENCGEDTEKLLNSGKQHVCRKCFREKEYRFDPSSLDCCQCT